MSKLQASILSLATIGGIVALIVWQFLPQPHIAQQHPLRYYPSLPVKWSPDGTWLIWVIIDGVNQGHFLWNVLRFQQAQHRLPFIAEESQIAVRKMRKSPYQGLTFARMA